MWTAHDILILQGPDGPWTWSMKTLKYHCVAWLAARKWHHMRAFISLGGLYDTEAAVERYENMRKWGMTSPSTRVPRLEIRGPRVVICS